ncbi:SIR2 family protein [Burkholderia gladioli]|uniref:P-loop NTPase n=1 Tax=Burkholderia gladioli TaxID=28095 RepID=UPI0016410369|nr:SIR2 family protein [Burkholderia gladioli]
MNEHDNKILINEIAPLLARGELSLLLGAGFSIENHSVSGEKLPGGDALKLSLLKECGKAPGAKTTLKDAYQFAKSNLPDFDKYFASCFTVEDAFSWQRKIFNYVWSRIYTTNVDNVLNVALSQAANSGTTGGEFKFFNYLDEGLVSETIGTIPVVTIHGTCLEFQDGFVFSSLEYAKQTNKLLDWHNDLASRILAGGVIVVGNQLEESDFDSYIARRRDLYAMDGAPKNWIVGPNPDEIRAENLRAVGFEVIDATAEEFFMALFSYVKPRTIGEIVLDTLPSARRAAANRQAMTWFRSAFSLVFEKIESARKERGIIRHFITGEDPEWYYIVNDVHAETQRGRDLTATIANLLSSNTKGIGILHVIGPSGSGKTTAIRNSLKQLSPSYPAIFEFNPEQSMEKNFLRSIVENITSRAVLVFYSASEFYYAIKEVGDRLKDRGNPYCLFVLEDRSSDYKKSKNQLNLRSLDKPVVEFGDLSMQDATNIAQKIEDAGLKFEKFSEFDIDRRAAIILDKEKGFEGDLLSALFSLTTHENFERKLFEDYQSAQVGLPKRIVDLVAIVHSHGFRVPINYISGALGETMENVSTCIAEQLAGIMVVPPGTSVVQCRHRVIASYYFDNYIAGQGDPDLLVGLLEFLSRQFTVDDIGLHPLAYRVYRELISFEFLYEKYFSTKSRKIDCEHLFNEAQSFYGKDGIFWLHFGRFYRKIGQLGKAIDCFRTGLEFYESYQTKHSLGLALIETYLDGGDLESYEEGIRILENERISRGANDPYPTATLLALLTKVLKRDRSNQDALKRAKECFNYGMKHFRDDETFQSVAKDYTRDSEKR